MTPTKNTIITDNADLITHYSEECDRLPSLYFDGLTGMVVAELPAKSQQEFYADAKLQRFLSVKKQVWRAINELRRKYAGGEQ